MGGDEYFFFGLTATNEYGRTKAIEIFSPERQEFVEFDISKLICDLMQREKRKVGVLSPSLPVLGPPDMTPEMMMMMQTRDADFPKPWLIAQQLGQTYNVVKATVKDGVIGSETQPDNMMGSAPRQGDFKANLDFLIVVQPKNLDEQTKFAIDQYVMKGGKLIIFEDPFCYFDRPPRDNPYGAEGFSQASDLNDLTAKWGLSMRPSTLAIDRSLALLRDNQGEPMISALVLDDHCTAHRRADHR